MLHSASQRGRMLTARCILSMSLIIAVAASQRCGLPIAPCTQLAPLSAQTNTVGGSILAGALVVATSEALCLPLHVEQRQQHTHSGAALFVSW